MNKTSTPGERLRAFRSERGFTGTTLAESLDCTRSIISYWEAGRTALPWTVCLAIEAAHGVSAHWLATGEGLMWLVPRRRKAKPTKGLQVIPFLEEQLGFNEDGAVIPPHPESPGLGLPPSLLKEVAGDPLPKEGDLYLWRVMDSAMEPLLPFGAWVLLDVSKQDPESLVANGIYLVRSGRKQVPCLRRVAKDPLSGDLLLTADTPRKAPQQIPDGTAKNKSALLGRAIWAGIALG